ncbi:Transcription factor TFIIIB complex subunit bdp1 [Hyphodiscus hymeniophilus]|uniref:Transcription factor TFIIIB complex subunit bdp1 n=1 Tax=Hyphodiscus hymeniophilus TaxID=353542 RepID=A0A9P7B092_9HELO|nr:Transcription factor TFIIIB complex subunit bdp1 [Hyphodiscus hymeniophilus]
MSLVVKKKGGRSFAPKIPQRRLPGAPTSAQSSARPSVERQSQTPAPHSHHVETITIDDDDTPAPSDELSRMVEHTPQPILDDPRDAFPHAHPTPGATDIPQNLSVQADQESLKRKSREPDLEVPEERGKRHQPSSLDAPRSPLPIEPLQLTGEQSQPIPLHPEPSHAATRSANSLQAERVATPPSLIEISTNAESSTSLTQASEPEIISTRHPLLGNAQTGRGGSPVVTTNGLGPAGDVGSRIEGGQLAQTPVIVPMAPLNPDGTPGEPVQQPTTGTKKKLPKRRKVQQGEDGGDVRATVEMQLNRPRRAPGKKSSRKKKDGDKKKKRAETPEGAENEEINAVEIKMVDLTKDLRIGKKFSIHDELRQREKEKIIKAQLAKTHPELVAVEVLEETQGVEGESREEVQPDGGGPRMKVVDGQIVVDTTSMQLDRQKRARAEQGEIEAVVENDFSKITTSGTHMKRERAQLWDMAANEIFWKGLRMFGTDFEMIAKMFPHRNRRQIKLKFNKEEKDNPSKVDKILKGAGIAIELDTYEELSGVKLEEIESIDAERVTLEAKHLAEEEERIAARAAAEKKKKEAIEAQRDTPRDVDDGSGEKENQPRSQSSSGIHPEGEKTYVRSKKARPRKDGAAGKPKKKPAADETVQVLGDA